MTVKLNRYFGKCTVKGCKTRKVWEGDPYLPNGHVIHYNGHNLKALREAGLWCGEHNRWLTWTQLQGRVNPEKECNGVCMAAVGPSCDCSCGGKNHGKNHVHI